MKKKNCLGRFCVTQILLDSRNNPEFAFGLSACRYFAFSSGKSSSQWHWLIFSFNFSNIGLFHLIYKSVNYFFLQSTPSPKEAASVFLRLWIFYIFTSKCLLNEFKKERRRKKKKRKKERKRRKERRRKKERRKERKEKKEKKKKKKEKKKKERKKERKKNKNYEKLKQNETNSN